MLEQKAATGDDQVFGNEGNDLISTFGSKLIQAIATIGRTDVKLIYLLKLLLIYIAYAQQARRLHYKGFRLMLDVI